MKLTRPFLIFLNPIYWVLTYVRNLFFDLGLFKSTLFHVPVIAVGNLSTGGTGKTPHTEYLIRLLKNENNVAVLSRGYRRKSVGFQLAENPPSATILGDEPTQIKNKFPEITVAVDANRVNGVQTLLALPNPPQVILLDDAYQHRKIQAGFYVLLTPFHHLYADDLVLPAGNLREPKAGVHRANCIVVTKCPVDLSAEKQREITAKLKPTASQNVFFSAINYGEIEDESRQFKTEKPCVLLTGIADAAPLVKYVENKKLEFTHLDFPDHHHFTDAQLNAIIETAKQKGANQILTTEKDFQRLDKSNFESQNITLAYLPIRVEFLQNGNEFDQQILDFVGAYAD